MLRPDKNRIDYGKQLQPPLGFELDAAIATTYSLDLNALLAIPIALCFHDTLEGDLKGEKMALFEAIDQLKGKLIICYQRGNVHLPKEYNRLFSLLEPFMAAIIPQSDMGNEAFCSFHPKFWLLRYKKKTDNREKRYRLIVLSRNLTFDRSWDLAVSVDGELTNEEVQIHPGLQDFVKSLSPHATDFKFITEAINDMPKVRWHCPPGFNQLRMLPGGGAHLEKNRKNFGRPIYFSSKVDDLLVISPFIDARKTGGLAWLAKQSHGKRYLLSRAEELDAIDPELLKDWQCYSLNGSVVDGEEMLEQSDARSQNLHAKLIVSRNGKTSHWHLGSANASSAALGEIDRPFPRNSEFMIRLTGPDDRVGPTALLKNLIADDGNGLFVQHQFGEVDFEIEPKDKAALRQLVHRLVSANWKLVARVDNNGQFNLDLKIVGDLSVPYGVAVKVGLLCQADNEQDLSESISWKGISLTSISALIPVKVKAIDGGIIEQLVVQTQLEIEGGDNRASLVLQQLVNTPDKFLNYIRLLLKNEPNKAQWLGIERELKGCSLYDGLNWNSPIFEQLMLAASRHPDQLKRIDLLLTRLVKIEAVIPEEFSSLWKHFYPMQKK